jgi:hypothetical protein
MSASASLIPELEDIIQHGSKEKRAATIKRIANLFVDSAEYFNEDHVGLFDDVLCRLVAEIETRTLPNERSRRSRMRRPSSCAASATTILPWPARCSHSPYGCGNPASSNWPTKGKPI